MKTNLVGFMEDFPSLYFLSHFYNMAMLKFKIIAFSINSFLLLRNFSCWTLVGFLKQLKKGARKNPSSSLNPTLSTSW